MNSGWREHEADEDHLELKEYLYILCLFAMNKGATEQPRRKDEQAAFSENCRRRHAGLCRIAKLHRLQGQVWRYMPSPFEGAPEEQNAPGKLELFVEPNDGNLVENADNLTVAPWGDLIVCEDGEDKQFLVGVTPKGEFYKFGKNAVSDSELAGVTFSPDGTTLFVNIQHEGLTLAIAGPWQG